MRILRFWKKVILNWLENNVFEHAAALAYMTLFSLGPTLILIIGILGMVYGQGAAEGRVFLEIKGLVGMDSAKALQDVIRAAGPRSDSIWATVLGFLLVLFGGSTVFAQLKSTLNQMWCVKADPEANDLVYFLKNRLLSLCMVFSMGFIMLLSFVTSTLLGFFGEFLSSFLNIPKIALVLMNGGISTLIVALLFAAIYKILPDVRLLWKEVLVGGIFSALLFTLGKFIIAFVISKTNISIYGAAASLIAVLLWVYYSALLLFMGNSFIQVWAESSERPLFHKKNSVWIKKEIYRQDNRY